MQERLERLTQLLEIKIELRKNAHRDLVNAQEEFKKNKLKHDQLVGYRKDYLKQIENFAEQGTVVARLRNRIDFIGHLDMALVQLNGHLAQLAKLRANAEMLYKQAKISEEGVCLLVNRIKKSQGIIVQRAEQKENDEYAQKQWYSNKIDE